MTLLRVDALAAWYGEVQVLHDVALHVGRGEIVAILGANGAGKTTLLRAISGVVRWAGAMAFADHDLATVPPHVRAGLGIVHVPEGRGLFPYMTVFENLMLGAYASGDRKGRRAALERVFAMFPVLARRRGQSAGTLSGGEQQMLAIGRSLMGDPQLLLLDEPSLGLAPRIFEQILDTIRRLNEAKLTVVLVEQMVRESLEVAHRGYVLSNGRVTLSGTAKELIDDDRVRAIYMGFAGA